MTRTRILALSSLLLSLLLSGCGLTSQQLAQTQSFGASAEKVGQLGEKEFINIRKGIIQMNQELVILDNTKHAKDLKFDRPATAERTAKRVAAAKALKSYGTLLVKLSRDDKKPTIQQSVEHFLTNTEAALQQPLDTDKKTALAKLVAGVGSVWVEQKKREALQEIVPTFEQPVNQLAALLAEDLSLDDGSLGYLKAYEVTAKRLKNAAIGLVNAGDQYSVLERARAVEALVFAETAMSRAHVINRKAGRALTRLKQANTELVKVLAQSEYSVKELKGYGKEIQELVNALEVIAD